MNKIRLVITAVLLLGLYSGSIFAQGNQTKQLYDNINTHWNNRAYTQVLTLLNNRLQSDANDTLALIMKANYYVFAEKDITQAHQATNAFLAVVNAGSDQNLKDQAQAMAKRVTDIPTSDTTPLTTAQRDALHAELDTFPFIDECFLFWGKFTQQL
ncbi:MAG: hypothetical protein AAGH72_02245 [Verrucomicrobiota bacterium]